MMYSSILPAMLALAQATSALVPAIKAERSSVATAPNEHEFVERTVFSRNDVLTPEDHEIAKRNGVDLNEMFKHSLYKRADGEHVTVWVHNSFNDSASAVDEDSSELEARQIAKISSDLLPHFNRNSPAQCDINTAEFHGTTHRNAPFTGGANAIIQWTHDNPGHWWFKGGYLNTRSDRNILLGGSNSGANMRFSIGIHPSDRDWDTAMGTGDIRHLVWTARNRYQQNIGGWRMEAHGGLRCNEFRAFRAYPWLTWVTHRTTGIL